MVGYANFIMFPHQLMANGGAAFFIPYTVAQFFVVVPAYILETAWGQLIRCKFDHKFSMVHPRWWGIGVAHFLMNMLILSFYIMMFAWTLRFFVDSLRSPLPWASEDGAWNTLYFKEEVLHTSESIGSEI